MNNKCTAVYETGIVFFGDYDEEKEELGKVQIKRLDFAYSLYKNETIKSIICVGGNRLDGSVKGSKMSAKYLIGKGIPDYKVYYDSKSYDTRTNWKEAKRIIDAMDFRSAAFISSPIHLFRISIISGLAENDQYCYDSYPLVLKNPFSYWNIFMKLNKELLVLTLYNIIPDDIYDNLIRKYRNFTYMMN